MPEKAARLKAFRMKYEVERKSNDLRPMGILFIAIWHSHKREHNTRQRLRQLMLCRAFLRPNSIGFQCPENAIQVAGAQESTIPGHHNGAGPSCKRFFRLLRWYLSSRLHLQCQIQCGISYVLIGKSEEGPLAEPLGKPG